MRKHTYTNDTAPTTNGSKSRPARYNMRQTCSVHARTVKVFKAIKELTEMPPSKCFADVWEEKMLPALEHIVWNAKEAPRSTKNFVLSLFSPLPVEDYVVNRRKALNERFAAATAKKKGL